MAFFWGVYVFSSVAALLVGRVYTLSMHWIEGAAKQGRKKQFMFGKADFPIGKSKIWDEKKYLQKIVLKKRIYFIQIYRNIQ